MNKTDEKAVERLLNRAVAIAIAELKIAGSRQPFTRSDPYRRVYDRNVRRFVTAIEAADMLAVAS